MKQLILVRAGSTAWADAQMEGLTEKPSPDDKRLQGVLPLPLSETGKASLRLIAGMLRATDAERIYSSGNESSGSTADFLTSLCELKAKTVVSLRELNCGLWQGLRIKEIKQRYGSVYKQWRSDPFNICPPEGENIRDAWQRTEEALIQINKKNHRKVAVIVAAPIVSGIIECLITQRTSQELWTIIDQDSPLVVFSLMGKNDKGVPLGTAQRREPAMLTAPLPGKTEISES